MRTRAWLVAAVGLAGAAACAALVAWRMSGEERPLPPVHLGGDCTRAACVPGLLCDPGTRTCRALAAGDPCDPAVPACPKGFPCHADTRTCDSPRIREACDAARPNCGPGLTCDNDRAVCLRPKGGAGCASGDDCETAHCDAGSGRCDLPGRGERCSPVQPVPCRDGGACVDRTCAP